MSPVSRRQFLLASGAAAALAGKLAPAAGEILARRLPLDEHCTSELVPVRV
jgi:hypothetical protein